MLIHYKLIRLQMFFVNSNENGRDILANVENERKSRYR